MTHPLPWLIAAVWAATALHVAVSYREVGMGVFAAVGLVACLVMAARDWWAAFRAYQPEGRHR